MSAWVSVTRGNLASPLLAKAGNRLQLTGSRFQGISQASGGNTQDSSSNYPIVQLRSIDNSQVAFLPVIRSGAGRTQALLLSR